MAHHNNGYLNRFNQELNLSDHFNSRSMRVINFGNEIINVPIAIGFAFDHLYFVIDSFDDACGDTMCKVVHQARPVGTEGVGKFPQVEHSRRIRLLAPLAQICPGLILCGTVPKLSQLLLEYVGRGEGLVDRKQSIQPDSGILIELFSSLEKQVASSPIQIFVYDLLGLVLLRSELIERFSIVGHDMESVIDDGNGTQVAHHPIQVRGPHVHCDGLGFDAKPAKSLEERLETLLCPIPSHPEYSSSLQINHNGQIFVPFLDADLVNAQDPDSFQIPGLGGFAGQSLFIDLFDCVPMHPHILSHILDSHHSTQIHDITLQCPIIAFLGRCQADRLLIHTTAVLAKHSAPFHLQEDSLGSDWHCFQNPLERSLPDDIVRSAARTSKNGSGVYLKEDTPPFVLGANKTILDNVPAMIQYTRGHLRTPFPESYLLNILGKYRDVHFYL